MVSYHADDVAEGYCGNCHDWTRKAHNVYRDGRVHVQAEMCSTCIFRAGNLMNLEPGQLARLVAEATEEGSSIVCHQTLDGDAHAVCRGFFNARTTPPLELAAQLGLVEWV
jgi:hypothetical protein